MHYLPCASRYASFTVLALCVLLAACADQSANLDTANGNAQMIAGTWELKARSAADGEAPAEQRIMRLILTPQGTFTAQYRGNPSQNWIRAGEGGFSYAPPMLTLYWDNGATVTLLVTEQGPQRMRVHHGCNLVPLKSQDPDEIFEKQKIERGPTQKAS